MHAIQSTPGFPRGILFFWGAYLLTVPRFWLTALLRAGILLITLFLLSACVQTPVTRTLLDSFSKGVSVDDISLNPDFRYLRVSAQGRQSLLVLGYIDPHPSGPVETWYSGSGEVLRLQNGRIVSTQGLQVDWRAVRHSAPPHWSDIPDSLPVEWVRERDEMPGYRFNITETLVLRAIAAPEKSRLAGMAPEQLFWVEETVHGSRNAWSSARYGLDFRFAEPAVVYGEQCLSPDLCITWQTWPVTP